MVRCMACIHILLSVWYIHQVNAQCLLGKVKVEHKAWQTEEGTRRRWHSWMRGKNVGGQPD
jgi:hypothetical protein